MALLLGCSDSDEFSSVRSEESATLGPAADSYDLADFAYESDRSDGLVTLKGEPNCSFPAPKLLPGVNFYVNPNGHGDQADPALVARHQELQRPLVMFMFSAGRAIDGVPRWSNVPIVTKTCVQAAFEYWAATGAYLEEPTVAAAKVQRVLWTVGFNVMALKLRQTGVALPQSVIDWLESLTRAVMKTYGHRGYKHKGFHNNISAWTGAAAATFLAVVQAAPKYRSIIDEEREIFLSSLRGIDAAGMVKSELERGANALLYSAFYLSALAMNVEARKVYGYQETPYARRQIDKALSAFGGVFCGSSDAFFQKAGVKLTPKIQSEKKAQLNPSGLRVLFGLGMFERQRLSCVQSADHFVDAAVGGDVSVTRKTLMQAARHWRP